MFFKLSWSILGARRFNFVQMKCPGSQMFLSQKGAKKAKQIKKSDEPVDQMKDYLTWIIPMQDFF